MATEKEIKQANTVFDSVLVYLDKHEWKYEPHRDTLTVTLATKGYDLVIPILIKVNPELMVISVYSQMPFDVPDEMRVPITVAVTAANYCIVDGSFDYDVKEGHIVYRITSSFRDSIISEAVIEYLLMCACVTADAYNDKFDDMIKDKASPQQMLDIIYKKEA